MRNLALVLIGFGLTCGIDAAADDIRFFLSEQGLSDPNDVTSPAITPDFSAGDPTVPGGSRLYIWAEMMTPNADWLAVEFDFHIRSGDAVISQYNIFNYQALATLPRWWSSDDNEPPFQGSPNSQELNLSLLYAFSYLGIRDDSIAQQFDMHYDATTNSTLLGYIDVVGTSGEIHMSSLGAAPRRTPMLPEDRIFIGRGDLTGTHADPFSPAHGIGMRYDTPTPEATIVPEPAMFSLFGIAVLAFRRCRQS